MKCFLFPFILISIPSFAGLSLPRDFKFCVSTSAHQNEGGNDHSDWWKWEQIPGKIKNSERSGLGIQSDSHFREDVAHMKWLGVGTYRMSVEWAKIEPSPGNFDLKVLQNYRKQVDYLIAHGIEPMVTLNHFTLPLWVADRGGWEWSGIPVAFEFFTAMVAHFLGTKVKTWITLNEPMTLIAAGYMSNLFPPGKNRIDSIGRPMEMMLRAHANAYRVIHMILDSPASKPRVGIAHHLRVFDPVQKDWIDEFGTEKFDEVFNWAIPEALRTGKLKFNMIGVVSADASIPEAAHTQDFFGLNYYSRDRVHIDMFAKEKLVRKVSEHAPIQDLGWEIYPQGLTRLIDKISQKYPKLSIWITENGVADRSDHLRSKFTQDHLSAVARAITKGAKIEGYCHWTLNDNFEWIEGTTAKFGLFSVNPSSYKRVAKLSARDFKWMIEQTKLGTSIF